MPARTTETARVPEDIIGRQRRMPVGGITWRHTFRPLRHRNYRLFFWGQLVSLIGTWMQQTAMSWYVYQITNSKLLLGVVSAVGSAPMMLSSIWGGALADLYPKRSILVATQAAQMICAFLLAAGVVAWIRDDSVHHHRRRAERNFDGLRHAGAPGVYSRNDQSRRFAERDLTQQLDREWSARHRPVRRWLDDWRGRRGDVLFPERPQLYRRDRGFIDDASAASSGGSRSFFSRRARMGGNLVFDKTSARAHDFAAIFSSRRLRLVLCRADARRSHAMCSDAAQMVTELLMSASGVGAFVGALLVATFGHLFTPRKIALGGVWLFSVAMLAVRSPKVFRLRSYFLFAAGFGMLLFFSTSNTVLPNHRAGRNAGTCHGRVVAGVRRHDSPWQSGSRSRCAFRRHTVGARVRRNHLRRVGAGDVVRDSSTRSTECEIACWAGASGLSDLGNRFGK